VVVGNVQGGGSAPTWNQAIVPNTDKSAIYWYLLNSSTSTTVYISVTGYRW
jgi:hypothetical protein